MNSLKRLIGYTLLSALGLLAAGGAHAGKNRGGAADLSWSVGDAPPEIGDLYAEGAEYLVISADGLDGRLLAENRARAPHRFSTASVPLAAIREWSSQSDPGQAVKDFLAFVLREWTPVPQYVVLVGDGDETRGSRGDLFPSMGGQDRAFALVDDDPYADFALGRIPARTQDELVRYLGRIERYEKEGTCTPGAGIFSHITQLIGDRSGSGSSDPDFRELINLYASRVRDFFPGEMAHHLFRSSDYHMDDMNCPPGAETDPVPTYPWEQARNNVMRGGTGSFLINAFGQTCSGRTLAFLLDFRPGTGFYFDAGRMETEFAFLLGGSDVVNDYHRDGILPYRSKVEQMLFSPGGGIIGSLGSSGPAYLVDIFPANGVVARRIFGSDFTDLGTLWEVMARQVSGAWVDPEGARLAMNVLGDPALKLCVDSPNAEDLLYGFELDQFPTRQGVTVVDSVHGPEGDFEERSVRSRVGIEGTSLTGLALSPPEGERYYSVTSTSTGAPKDTRTAWKLADVAVDVVPNTHLSYLVYSEMDPDPAGGHVAVDVELSDGGFLSSEPLLDLRGAPIHPEGRATQGGQWVEVVCDISRLSGKTIRTLLAYYDNSPELEVGEARAHLDHVRVFVPEDEVLNGGFEEGSRHWTVGEGGFFTWPDGAYEGDASGYLLGKISQVVTLWNAPARGALELWAVGPESSVVTARIYPEGEPENPLAEGDFAVATEWSPFGLQDIDFDGHNRVTVELGIAEGTFLAGIDHVSLLAVPAPEPPDIGIGSGAPGYIEFRRLGPNPAIGRTNLLLFREAPGAVVVRVFDATGRLVRKESFVADGGEGSFPLGLVNDRGEKLSSGLYFIRLETSSHESATRKILVIK